MIFLVLYCLLLLLSIFSASWRLSITALGFQAIGMGAYLIYVEPHISWHHSIAIGELFLLKGLVIPWFLVRRFNRAKVPRFIDLIPANLLHWTIAIFFVAFCYLAASELTPGNFREIMLVGASLSAVALGMLALSSQNDLPGQLISVLTIENGISLFAIGQSHGTSWALELLGVLDFVTLVILSSNFLRRLSLIHPTAESDSTATVPPMSEQSGQSLTSTDYGDVL